MIDDVWLGETVDFTDYILLKKWEQMIREAKPRSPSEFHAAVKNIFPDEILPAWDQHCTGGRKRSWVGIETAAKEMHLDAFKTSQILKTIDVSAIQTAANTIFGVLPEIQRDRKNERFWAELNFCTLCWRLAPSGYTSMRRLPLCEKHNVINTCDHPQKKGETIDKKNPEYRKHHRLQPYFKDHLLKIKRHIGSSSEWDGKVTTKKFPFLVKYIKDNKGDKNDLEGILKLLLLDVSDPVKKIEKEINEWLTTGDGFIFGTFTYAETWLSLIASKPLGGDRKSQYSPNYSEETMQEAVIEALNADRPIAQTAKKMGIPDTTLHDRIKKAKKSKS